jgi:hypothetical protein
MNTNVFCMFPGRATSQQELHFRTTPFRKQLPNPNSTFHTQKHKLVSKLLPKCLTRRFLSLTEINQHPYLDPEVSEEVSQEVSPWIPASPKWLPRVQKGTLRAKMKVLGICINMDPHRSTWSCARVATNATCLLTWVTHFFSGIF